MHLPGKSAGAAGAPGAEGAIDESQAVRLIRQGIDDGINYIDLGLARDTEQHQSIARSVRRALEDGYLARVKLAITVPASAVASPNAFDVHLERQLSWLGLASVDFCLLGRLTRDNWPALLAMGILDRLDEARADGRIVHAGFSFHDHYQVLKSIVQAYDKWTACSVEYSYMDVAHDPGASGIRYAAEQGLAVIATKPFKDGRLTRQPPEEVGRVWARSTRDWSLAEWALRFVLNHPGVSVAVADVSSPEQLAEDARVADVAGADSLTVQDEITIGTVRDTFRKRQEVPCPSCRPCMPCPAGIDVPRFFEIYNDAVMYGDVETARSLCTLEGIDPQRCDECRVCEARCAKRLPIVDWLAKGRSELEG
jgi:predicted aldo/keto reductase-like oxidoreductase